MKRIKSIFLLSTLALLFVTQANANLLMNGSFETGVNPPTGGYRNLIAINNDISGWTVSAGNIDWIYSYYEPSDGIFCLDLTGNAAGKIEQSFPTINGQSYSVSFDMAGNPVTWTGITQLQVEAAGQSKIFSFNNSGQSITNMGWETNTWTFIANSSITTLSFTSLGYYNRSGPALDNVKVEPLSSFNRLPDTGQTKCYDNQTEIQCPLNGSPFYGQDGIYNYNQPSYTKLDQQGNQLPVSATEWSMVRDNNTGLTWEVKTEDGSIHDKDNVYTWPNAQSEFIDQLNSENYGGFNDWRLPTIKEISLLVDVDKSNPSINVQYFPNTVNGYYWSSTDYGEYIENAYNILFSLGYVSALPKINYNIYVRAVRGEISKSNFVDNSDGTVTDLSTGLMWQQAATYVANWEDALSYCEMLNLAGHEDWRLPNKNELHTISKLSQHNPAIDTNYFFDTPLTWLLSSSTNSIVNSDSWFLRIDNGMLLPGHAKSNALYVRAVRNLSLDFTNPMEVQLIDHVSGYISPEYYSNPPEGAVVVHVVSPQSVEETITNLKKLCVNRGRPINRLVIYSHASRNNLPFFGVKLTYENGESLNDKNIDNYRTAFESLRPYLGDVNGGLAHILLFSCNLAANAEGNDLVHKLSLYTNSCVHASTNYTGNVIPFADYNILLQEYLYWFVDGYGHVDWDLEYAVCPYMIINAALNSNDDINLVFPDGIVIQIEEGSLNNDGTIIITNTLDNLEILGIPTDGLVTLSAYNINLEGTEVHDGKYIRITTPYSEVSGVNETNMEVKYWNEELQQWLNTGITIIEINENENYITFETNHTSIFALVSDICEGDFDDDGVVGGLDFTIFVSDFGRIDCVSACDGNLDNDSDSDGLDLSKFIDDYGRSNCPVLQ